MALRLAGGGIGQDSMSSGAGDGIIRGSPAGGAEPRGGGEVFAESAAHPPPAAALNRRPARGKIAVRRNVEGAGEGVHGRERLLRGFDALPGLSLLETAGLAGVLGGDWHSSRVK